MGPALLELKDIRKSFPVGPTRTEVLNGIDLDIRKGDLAAVVGASGSGKSTFMSILGLLDAPTSGSYRFEGQEVARLDDDAVSSLRSRRIGFVFQSFQLLSPSPARSSTGRRSSWRTSRPAPSTRSAGRSSTSSWS